jgi:hypothetical protein
MGHKTYIIAALIAVLAAVKYLGYVDEATFQALVTLLAGGGLTTMRLAVSSAADDAVKKAK